MAYKLVPVDYIEVIKALSKIGYVNDHQHGSHIVLYLVDKNKYSSSFGERKPAMRIVVPAHKPFGRLSYAVCFAPQMSCIINLRKIFAFMKL